MCGVHWRPWICVCDRVVNVGVVDPGWIMPASGGGDEGWQYIWEWEAGKGETSWGREEEIWREVWEVTYWGGFEGNSRVVSGSCYRWTTHRVYLLLSLFLHLSFISFNRDLDLSSSHFSPIFPITFKIFVLGQCFVLHFYPILIIISIYNNMYYHG